MPRKTVVDSLLPREKLGSTGLGQGVAIPHGRIRGLVHAQGAFVRLKSPIPFDAPDGKPVAHVFVLLVPEQATEKHLQLLSELAQMFSETRFREGLAESADAAGVHPVPPLKIHLQRSVSIQPESDPPPSEIVQALSRLMLYRMQERARIEIEKGNLEAGTRQLQALAANLLTQGERSLAQTIMLEVNMIQHQNGISEEGRKKIKYGTRALFLAPPRKEFAS